MVPSAGVKATEPGTFQLAATGDNSVVLKTVKLRIPVGAQDPLKTGVAFVIEPETPVLDANE